MGGVDLTEKVDSESHRASIKPEDVRALAEALVDISTKIAPVVLHISNSIRSFYLSHEKEFKAIGEVLIQVGKHFYVHNEFRENCKKHDIIPHEYLYELLQKNTSFFLLNYESQSQYLSDNWYDLKSKLLVDYRIITGAGIRSEFFEEILKAHELGLYKVCVRSTVIEIEGLASEFCRKYESVDNINRRKKMINNWEALLEKTEASFVHSYYIFLSFDNYIANVYRSSDAMSYNSNVTDSDLLLSRNFHAHGLLMSVSERQSLNAILFLHNVAKYFKILSEFIEQSDSSSD